MKKVLSVSLISLFILIAVHQTLAVAEDRNLPKGIEELHSRIDQTFQIQTKTSFVKEPDRLETGQYFTICLEGSAYLEKVPDPFETMERLFLSDGWRANERYQADGHGSSSSAYEKEKYFCLVSVAIDSSCDDEETGHVPSEFWFTIYCRERR